MTKTPEKLLETRFIDLIDETADGKTDELTFSFSSERFLKYDIPCAFAATRKISKNSSIEALLSSGGHFIGIIFFSLLILF